jgi:hypothetical protein
VPTPSRTAPQGLRNSFSAGRPGARLGQWGEVFGDDTVAAAMIDRLVHHADVVSLRGDSYRLKDRDLGRTPTEEPT